MLRGDVSHRVSLSIIYVAQEMYAFQLHRQGMFQKV